MPVTASIQSQSDQGALFIERLGTLNLARKARDFCHYDDEDTSKPDGEGQDDELLLARGGTGLLEDIVSGVLHRVDDAIRPGSLPDDTRSSHASFSPQSDLDAVIDAPSAARAAQPSSQVVTPHADQSRQADAASSATSSSESYWKARYKRVKKAAAERGTTPWREQIERKDAEALKAFKEVRLQRKRARLAAMPEPARRQEREKRSAREKKRREKLSEEEMERLRAQKAAYRKKYQLRKKLEVAADKDAAAPPESRASTSTGPISTSNFDLADSHTSPGYALVASLQHKGAAVAHLPAPPASSTAASLQQLMPDAEASEAPAGLPPTLTHSQLEVTHHHSPALELRPAQGVPEEPVDVDAWVDSLFV